MNSLLVRGNEEREMKGKKMKEKLYITEGIKNQIQEGLMETLKDLEPFFFRIQAFPQVLMLERVILEIFPYSTAYEILMAVETTVAEYEKNKK